MKKHVKLGIVLGMIFLTGNLFGQAIGENPKKSRRPGKHKPHASYSQCRKYKH